jgi:hypothetical protein
MSPSCRGSGTTPRASVSRRTGRAEELLRRQRGSSTVRAYSVCYAGPIADSRDGKTEVSYLVLPRYWGQGYGRRSPPPRHGLFDTLSTARLEVVAVTQQTNARSCKRLESVGMTVVDKFVEYDAAQVMSAVRRDTLSRA